MKIVVQIPCYNEAATLPLVVESLPRSLPGIDQIEVLVIDDGSTDGTGEAARSLGVHHVIRHPFRRGLAAAFESGLEAALALGADVIVNTDGDNQYPQQEIGRLIQPILADEADIVVGDRQTASLPHFSTRKRLLQAWGSWVVRLASGTAIPDATSGFRAYSRDAALRLNIFTRYTYTLETIIQAGKKGLRVASVPITVNLQTRASRLIRSEWDYVKRSAATIVRIYAVYEPLRTFGLLSLPFGLAGAALIGRFFYFYLRGEILTGDRFLQSVILGAASLVIAFVIFLFGVLADLVGANRLLLEDVLYRLKRLDGARQPAPDEPGRFNSRVG